MISAAGLVKLVDFGVAKDMDRETVSSGSGSSASRST